mmetsp:Transcript_2589/g.6019  ORF Transcript_2589/g.6019 Transcript_2589/m.6019 type:complete len:210 (+) Transcript_2589:79-708(+)
MPPCAGDQKTHVVCISERYGALCVVGQCVCVSDGVVEGVEEQQGLGEPTAIPTAPTAPTATITLAIASVAIGIIAIATAISIVSIAVTIAISISVSTSLALPVDPRIAVLVCWVFTLVQNGRLRTHTWVPAVCEVAHIDGHIGIVVIYRIVVAGVCDYDGVEVVDVLHAAQHLPQGREVAPQDIAELHGQGELLQQTVGQQGLPAPARV